MILPPPARLHVRIGRLAAEEGAGEVGVQHLVPFREGVVLRRLADVDAGVVDQDVEPAAALDRLVRPCARHARLVGHVGRDRDASRPAPSARRRRRSSARCAPAIATAAPACASAARHAEADAAVAAGDERRFAVQVEEVHAWIIHYLTKATIFGRACRACPGRRGAPLQPILHTPHRRAAAPASRQPVPAAGGAPALRARPARALHRERAARRARAGRGLSQPAAGIAQAGAAWCAPSAQATTRAPGRSRSRPRAARPSRCSTGARAPRCPPCWRSMAAPHRDRLVDAMRTVQSLLTGPKPLDVLLRAHRPGDIGWVVQAPRRALRAGVRLGRALRGAGRRDRFASSWRDFDARRSRCWIAELRRRARRLGFRGAGVQARRASCACCWSSPRARGRGLGTRLVQRMHRLRARAGLPQARAVDAVESRRGPCDLPALRLSSSGKASRTPPSACSSPANTGKSRCNKPL